MSPQDLDTLIDAAAREMVAGDPSRALSHRVMSEVRGRIEPAPRGWVWVFRTAGAVVLCAVVATLVVSRNQVHAPVSLLPASETSQTRTGEQPVAPPGAPTVSRQPGERLVPRLETRRVALGTDVPPAPARDVEAPLTPSVEPLAIEPIMLSGLDVPPLENQPTTIDDIEISDITIEPLAASND